MHRTLYIPVAVLLLLTIGLELLSIHLSQKLASDSITVRKLQESIATLDEENQILNVRLLNQTSFEEISKKATAMGFSENAKYLTLQEKKLSLSR
jgi:hypothetical protein